ncbi:MAG TPA: shikimate kinase [Jeotgalicoccus sp.]|nr:shikimate kinase [Jeotgalicoccus sp.]
MILIGFMGSGKTTVGIELAKILDKPFIDLDQQIVLENNMKIPDIFNKFGEAGFRQREYEALKNVIEKDAIISTGGGIITYPDSFDLLRNNSKDIFYLEIPFEISFNRIKNDENRPLTKSKRSDLEKIFEYRIPLYKKLSDYSINGSESVNDIIHNILMHKK